MPVHSIRPHAAAKPLHFKQTSESSLTGIVLDLTATPFHCANLPERT